MDNPSIISIANYHAQNSDPVWRFPAEKVAYSLSEILSEARQLAGFLKGNGVKAQDRVGFVMNNSSMYIKLMLATWMLNGVVVPLRPQGGKYLKYGQYLDEIDAVCDLAILIHDADIPEEPMEEWARQSQKPVYSVSNLLNATSDRISISRVLPQADELAVLQFTSGSTGSPKGVMVTHKMVLEQLKQLHGNHFYSRGGKTVQSAGSWLPLNHDMGLFIGFLLPVFDGCENILSPTSYYMRNPARWFKLMAEYDVDLNFSTNSVLFSSFKSIARLANTGIKLSSLHIYVAAEKVHPNILREAQKLFGQLGMPETNFHIGYGMAENALGCTRTPKGLIKTVRVTVGNDRYVQLADKDTANHIELVSVGIPNVSHEITIRNEKDDILPDLQLGEINIVSECVTPGYFNNPEATKKSLAAGRLRTGDLGFKYEGEFYFYSRRDDMLISNGRNIIPDDIEVAVEKLDEVGVGRSCLLGIESLDSGVLDLILLLEAKKNLSNESASKLRVMIQAQVFQQCDVLISKVILCERGTIEKTSSGKKRRRVIKQRYLKNEIAMVGIVNERAA